MSDAIETLKDAITYFDMGMRHSAIKAVERALQALQSGEPVVFTCHGNNAPAYGCNKPGDMSGTYYKAPQPVVDEGTTTPPCDCIENVNGRWVQSCECRSTGDLLSAQDWCTYNNLLSAGAVATQQLVVDVNQQLIDALLPFVQNSSVQALVPVTCEIAEEALLKAGKGGEQP
jgi:hypothetical protein